MSEKSKLKNVLKLVLVFSIGTFFLFSNIFVMASTTSGCTMVVADATVSAGDTGVVIEISGEWDADINGLSIGIQYDASVITIVNVDNTSTISENAYVFVYDNSPPGDLTIGVLWLPEYYPPEGSGIIAKLVIDIDEEAEDGDYTLDLTTIVGPPEIECIYSDADLNTIYPDLTDGTVTVGEAIVCGDYDGNGEIDISDLVGLVDYMFTGGPPPVPICRMNVDGSPDLGVDISDLVYLVDYMFNSGPPPSPNCCG